MLLQLKVRGVPQKYAWPVFCNICHCYLSRPWAHDERNHETVSLPSDFPFPVYEGSNKLTEVPCTMQHVRCQKAAPINTMHSSSKIIWVPLTLLLFIRSCSSTNIICINPVVRGQKNCWCLEQRKVYWKSQARSSCSKKSRLPDGFQGRVFTGKVREKVQCRWSPPSLFSDWLMMR